MSSMLRWSGSDYHRLRSTPERQGHSRFISSFTWREGHSSSVSRCIATAARSAQADAESEPDPFKIHDDRFPQGTLLIESPLDVGNLANLYPEIRMDAAAHTNGFRNQPAPPELEVACRPGNQGLTPQFTGSPGNGSLGHDGYVSERASEE